MPARFICLTSFSLLDKIYEDTLCLNKELLFSKKKLKKKWSRLFPSAQAMPPTMQIQIQILRQAQQQRQRRLRRLTIRQVKR